jgi:hypothetical protein
MAEPAQQITLVADERRYDVVVPRGTRMADILAVLGVASSATPSSVATAAGHIYGPHDRVDERLPAGTVLTVVRTTTHQVTRGVVTLDTSAAAPGARSSAPAWAGGGRAPAARPEPSLIDDSTRRRGELDSDRTIGRAEVHRGPQAARRPRRVPRNAPATTGALVLGVAVLALVAVALIRSGAGLDAPADTGRWARWAVTVLLLGAAVVATVVSGRDGRDRGLVRLAAAPTLAITAGLIAPLPPTPARGAIAGVVGGAAAVLVLALGSVDAALDDRGARTAAGCLGGFTAVLAAGVLLGWPLVSSAAILAGIAPVLVRALPSASLDVDATQLVDTARLSTTVWAVREQHRRRRRVAATDIQVRVRQARSVVAVGTMYLTLQAAIGGWVVALAPAHSDLAPWARWALPGVVALALAYQARTIRDRARRYAMLTAAAALAGAMSVALPMTGPGRAWAVVVAGVLLAAVAIIAALALAQGWRSPRMSRLADRVESVAVVLAFPLGLLAAGAVEALRRATSG